MSGRYIGHSDLTIKYENHFFIPSPKQSYGIVLSVFNRLGVQNEFIHLLNTIFFSKRIKQIIFIG